MKKCNTCGTIKPFDEFHTVHTKKNNKTVYRSDCKICYRKKKHKRDKKINQEYEVWYKSIPKKCERCGEEKPYLIDFHHVNPVLKKIEISQIKCRSWSLQRKISTATEEMDKCIQLCSNCHREFHYLERHNNISLDEYI